jgi:hypothetical protein
MTGMSKLLISQYLNELSKLRQVSGTHGAQAVQGSLQGAGFGWRRAF